VREVLAFLKAIMFSGNRHVQEGMEHLLFTREEHLFTTMQKLLTDAAITHRERWVQSVGVYPVCGSFSDLNICESSCFSVIRAHILQFDVQLCFFAMQANPSVSDGSQTGH